MGTRTAEASEVLLEDRGVWALVESFSTMPAARLRPDAFVDGSAQRELDQPVMVALTRVKDFTVTVDLESWPRRAPP